MVAPEGTPRISSREPDDLATDAMVRPENISPERVLGEPATTATDIYALGLVLYELLTGHHPYQIPGGEESEIYKAVCEQPPERPSLAVNRPDRANPESSHQTSEIKSAARGTTPRKLQRLLAGDLELIVLKALQKEPERRYGSADQFAEDIDRYFAGRPVRAHRDGRLYRLGKLIRRHPAVTAIGILALAALGIALIGTRVSLVRARQEQNQTEAAFGVAQAAVNDLSRVSPTSMSLTYRDYSHSGQCFWNAPSTITKTSSISMAMTPCEIPSRPGPSQGSPRSRA